MVAILTIALTLLLSAACGWGVYLLVLENKSRATRWVWSGLLALVVCFFDWAVVSNVFLYFPATDNPVFSRRAQIELTVAANKPPLGLPSFIKLDYPEAVQVNEDAYAEAVLTFPTDAPNLNMAASLESGKEVAARTLQPCTDHPGGASKASATDIHIEACAAGATRSVRFRWIVRSDKPGSSLATIGLPRPVVEALGQADVNWRASLVTPNRSFLFLESAPGSDKPDSGGAVIKTQSTRPRIRGEETIIVLTPSNPRIQADGADIDLGSGQITVPLRFETTLGVSAGVSDWLTQLGAIASAVLGGGWLWQFLSWRKSRIEAAKAAEDAKAADAAKAAEAARTAEAAAKEPSSPARPASRRRRPSSR